MNTTRLLVMGLTLLLPGAGVRAQDTRPESASAQESRDGRLSLSEAVSMALRHHPAVSQAQAQRDGALAGVRQARGSRLPFATTEGSLTRFQEPMVVAPLHGFDPLQPPSFDRNLIKASLTVGYTLYDGGARGGKIRQAESWEEAAVAGERRAGMEVEMEVSSAFLEVLTAGELLEAALSGRSSLEAEEERVRLLLSEGKAAQLDLLRVQAALSGAEATEISVQAGMEVALGRLARLTGLARETLEGLELTPVGLRERNGPDMTDVMARARAGSPDLEVARKAVEGAAAGVRVAEAARLPRMEAGGSYSDYGTLDGGHQTEWLASLRFSYPLFTGGVRKGERDRALAQEREAVEGLRLAEMGIEDGVEEALAAVRETRARVRALSSAVDQSEEVARIEALALEAGAGVQTDFLRAEAALFQARGALAQARHGEVLARIRLARVTGELTVEWFSEQLEELR